MIDYIKEKELTESIKHYQSVIERQHNIITSQKLTIELVTNHNQKLITDLLQLANEINSLTVEIFNSPYARKEEVKC